MGIGTATETLFGNYRLNRKIAEGAHGAVFESTHTVLKRKTCLKIFSEKLSQETSFAERLEKASAAFCSLDIQGMARIFEAGLCEGRYFIAAEFLDQFTPLSSENRENFPAEKILLQVGTTLKALHALGTSYLGLSLKHILIDENGVCKLSAFGFAEIERPLDDLKRAFATALRTMGDEGELFETLPDLDRAYAEAFFFLSPEQKWPWRHQKPGPHSDWYALGVLGYFLLEGFFPEGSARLSPKHSSLQPLIDSLLHPHAPQRHFNPSTAKSPVIQSTVSAYQPTPPPHSHIEPLRSKMVIIEEGTFFRGSKYGPRDEMPRHEVQLNKFAIDIHPVTNEQYVRFLEANGDVRSSLNNDLIRLKDSRISKSQSSFWIESGYAKHPVVGVTWYGATAYTQWLGLRLPTEAEWEAAAGGAGDALYPTGEKIDKKSANFFGSDTTAVMSYPAGINNLYDMAGNVYEWCNDWYDFHAYDLAIQEPVNPQGPVQGVYRVLRGGCWKSLENDLRTAHRHRNNPGAFEATYGFRCVSDV